MIITVDAHIPFVAELFSGLGTLNSIPGHQIGPKDVQHADALIVRSVTQVDAGLLSASNLAVVGSATAGTDHLDLEYLQSRGIEVATAAGANAESVVEYVLAALAEGAARLGEALSGRTVGIVGAGNVGRQLNERLQALGLETLVNDPPRARREGQKGFVDLEVLLKHADILTLHTPLVEEGPFRTRNLLDADAISRIKRGGWVIHTARGGVANEASLVRARLSGRVSWLVLDVWEDEPRPRLGSTHAADLATPHIAGYSQDAKLAGVRMIRDALIRHMNREVNLDLPERSRLEHQLELPAFDLPVPESGDLLAPGTLSALVAPMIRLKEDDERFRLAMQGGTGDAARFHRLRAEYPSRYSFSRYRVPGQELSEAMRTRLQDGIGVQVDA